MKIYLKKKLATWNWVDSLDWRSEQPTMARASQKSPHVR